ncbi:MAG TPA: hypothetical protein V6D19_00435 [Stenomitos sp.]
MKSEIINSLMPGFLALVGFSFGACALFAPGLTEGVRSNALATAGLAIAGAAGLAQPERKG